MDDRRIRAKQVNFERGQDPKRSMGIGKRPPDALDLKKGDLIDAFSQKEERDILVEVIEDKPSQNWSKVDGEYLDVRVKVLTPDYSNRFYGEDFEMIRTFPDDFDWWEMVE